jgi:hypothetical protein
MKIHAQRKSDIIDPDFVYSAVANFNFVGITQGTACRRVSLQRQVVCEGKIKIKNLSLAVLHFPIVELLMILDQRFAG